MTNARDALCHRSMPARAMGVIKGPALGETDAIENVRRELKSIGRVNVSVSLERIVAGRVIIAIFNKIDVVAQARQSHQKMQIAPNHNAQWTAHDITQDDNAQSFVHAVFSKTSCHC